jgi:hypothetical protein
MSATGNVAAAEPAAYAPASAVKEDVVARSPHIARQQSPSSGSPAASAGEWSVSAGGFSGGWIIACRERVLQP